MTNVSQSGEIKAEDDDDDNVNIDNDDEIDDKKGWQMFPNQMK